MSNTPLQLLKAAEREIQEAEAEVRVRQKQINELKPKRSQLEATCKTEFGCTPAELPEVLKQKEELVKKMVDDFIEEMKIAKES